LSKQALLKGKQDDVARFSKRKRQRQKGSIVKKNKISSSHELQNGVAKLVLTIVKVLIALLEKQAQRRVIAGNLTADETERLGLAFIDVKQAFNDIITKFGFKYEELDIPIASVKNGMTGTNNLDNKQLLSAPMLVDILDKLINKQTVIAGQVVISVADIELIVLNLVGMFLSSNSSRNGEEQS
jgi:hypothetical protein